MERSQLLDELRIDRDGGRPPRARVRAFALAAVVLLAVGVALWFWLPGWLMPTVRVAVAKAASPTPATGGSVLDASGYVTARRQATVSAKITGKVSQVLIE